MYTHEKDKIQIFNLISIKRRDVFTEKEAIARRGTTQNKGYFLEVSINWFILEKLNIHLSKSNLNLIYVVER